MPDKMDGLSLNPQADLLALLRERAPEVFVEGRVDAEKLAATLGQAVSTDKERYGLSWAGKSECFKHIQEPTTATLRPCKGESVNFDTTEIVFIRGIISMF
jgi:adenine-specific DNA-methyltransferase